MHSANEGNNVILRDSCFVCIIQLFVINGIFIIRIESSNYIFIQIAFVRFIKNAGEKIVYYTENCKELIRCRPFGPLIQSQYDYARMFIVSVAGLINYST